jgi:hypothetical protein
MWEYFLIPGFLFSNEAHSTAFYDVLIKGAIPEYSIHLGLNDSFTIGHLKKTIQNHEKIDQKRQKIYRAGNTNQELSDTDVVGPGDKSRRSLVVVVE